MSNQVTQQRQQTPQAQLNKYLTQHKNQIAAALPKHLNPDRMARLALTAFSQNKQLQQCDPKTVFSSLIVLSQLGLEPGIDGQGYLVPYGKICTPIPGWKGYVDLVSRAGRATVWTGAVFEGDDFDYQLGDSPFVRHRPGDETDESKLTHVYAVGQVNGAQRAVIEVWTKGKVSNHRDKYNKVGQKHYSYGNFEMYARKVVLLQVIKYMPKSVELQTAMEIDLASTEGKGSEFVNGEFVVIDENETVHPAEAKQPESPLKSVPQESQKPPEKQREPYLEEKAAAASKSKPNPTDNEEIPFN